MWHWSKDVASLGLQLLSSETGVTVPTFQAVVRTQYQTYTTYITCCSCGRCSGNATSLPILFLYLHSCPSSNAWNSLLCSEIFPIGPFFLRWLCGVYLVHLSLDPSLQLDIKQQLKDSVLYPHLHWLWPTKLRGVGCCIPYLALDFKVCLSWRCTGTVCHQDIVWWLYLSCKMLNLTRKCCPIGSKSYLATVLKMQWFICYKLSVCIISFQHSSYWESLMSKPWAKWEVRSWLSSV